jgi:hypothetical protein
MADLKLLEGLHEVASGPAGRVVWTPACQKEVEAAQAKQRDRLDALARKAVEFGFEELPKEQYTYEKRFSIGDRKGTEVPIFAFKLWQYRVYGTLRDWDGVRCFIGSCGVVKKRDKADQDELEKAAKRLRLYIEAISEKERRK